MRATLTLAALHFAMFPTQRRLMQAGAVLVALGAAMTLGGLSGDLVTLLGAVLLLVPLVATLGTVFRILSMPRTHRLLPFFRRRMLAATGLVLGAGTAATVWLASSSSDAPAVSASIAYAAVAWSALLWLPIFGLRGLAAFVPIALAAWVARHTFGLAFDDVSPPAVGVGLAAVWIAFAAWYLRGRPIAALAPRRSARPLRAPVDAGTVVRSVSAAERTDLHLYGSRALYGARAKARRFAIELTSVGVACFVLEAIAPAGGFRVAFAAPFAAAALCMPVARVAAARARRLWLCAPLDRSGLFGAVERALARSEPARLTVLATAIVVVHASLVGVAPRHVAAIMLAVGATAVAGACVGLMIPSRRHAADWVVGVTYGLTALAAAVAAAAGRTDVLLGVAAVQAASALLCRGAAHRRWQRIDWLALRVGRIERGT
ncbi:MAG TPA: hypothetical protein VF339_11465 [Gammaproteobacteria bacterium]